MQEILSLIGALIMIVLVLFATYYFTKAISKKMTASSPSRHIKIIDRVALSQNKFLLIVEIDKKFILLGVTDNSINVLKEFNDLNLEVGEANSIIGFSSDANFLEILKDNLKKTKLGSKFIKDNNNYNNYEETKNTADKDKKDGEV